MTPSITPRPSGWICREITDVFPKLEAEIGDVVFEAKNIVRADNKVKGVSLSVRRGEILGIGGLVGAGRSELVEGIFGMHELASGEIFVKGKQVKVHSPKDIIKEGVALITEDRKVTGLNLSGSVNDNIAMVAIKKLLSHGLYNKNKARAASMEYIKKRSGAQHWPRRRKLHAPALRCAP